MTRVSSALMPHPRLLGASSEPRVQGGAGRIESGKGVLIGDSVMVGPVQEVAASRLGPQATGESGATSLSPYRVIFAGSLAASLQWCRPDWETGVRVIKVVALAPTMQMNRPPASP